MGLIVDPGPADVHRRRMRDDAFFFGVTVEADDRAQPTSDGRPGLTAILEVASEALDVNAANIEQPVIVLPAPSRELTQPTSSSRSFAKPCPTCWQSTLGVLNISRMGSSLLITLREGLEIALVLAIIVAYLHKTGRGDRLGTIWAGSAVAAVLCIATGVLFHQVVGEFEGKWEQFIEGALAFAAVGVLTWMIFWMRGHARGISSDLQAKIDAAIDRSALALAFVAFIAVAREGFETVLFLLGAETSSSSGSAVVAGGIIGLGISAVIGYLFYLGSGRVDLKKFFNWTGLLLILFAAGLFAKGIHESVSTSNSKAAGTATPSGTSRAARSRAAGYTTS